MKFTYVYACVITTQIKKQNIFIPAKVPSCLYP